MAESFISNINMFEPEKFNSLFSDADSCYKFLAEQKWPNGFLCRKCGHRNYCKGRRPYSRRCTKCKSEESVTAHTIFHRCRIPITTAFKIMYTVCKNPDISSYKLSEEFDKRQMTCWKFKKRVVECKEAGGDAINFII